LPRFPHETEWRVIRGDCVDVMAEMDHSVDAIVTDPPYGLGFMNKEFDQLGKGKEQERWHLRWAKEAFRVLRPGGHLLAFGGTRTSHRLACALEDAGFELRDTVMWLYAAGFPKSLDVSKAIDKAAGAERVRVGQGKGRTEQAAQPNGSSFSDDNYQWPGEFDVTAPSTKEAKKWDGWGTGLKPSYEPIILARKPLVGTVVRNVLEHGCGAINIDGCRIATRDNLNGGAYAKDATDRSDYKDWRFKRGEKGNAGEYTQPPGRWPANVVLSHHPMCERAGTKKVKGSGTSKTFHDSYEGESATKFLRGYSCPGNQHADENGLEEVEDWDCHPECPIRLLNEQAGPRKTGDFCIKKTSGSDRRGNQGAAYGAESRASGAVMICHRDQTNDASRFFKTFGENCFYYCGKASKSERNAGLCEANRHPTVKPIELMRYLCRLITPMGGTVLDPFCGSGSTGVAARLEGFDFVGIEREDESAEVAEKRIEAVMLYVRDRDGRPAHSKKPQKIKIPRGQLDLDF